MLPKVRILCLLFGVLSGTASGAHITDKLVVGLYADPAVEGTPLTLLSSGTPVEVLGRRNGFAEVRLADDTRGWVDASYVTDEKPAKAMLLETQARLRQMGLELAALREKQAGQVDAGPAPDGGAPPAAQEAQLRQSLAQAEERIAELQGRLAARPPDDAAQERLVALQARVAEAVQILAGPVREPDVEAPPADEGPIGRYRMWIVGAIALLLGFGGGVAYVDYRIRRRYGGFRL